MGICRDTNRDTRRGDREGFRQDKRDPIIFGSYNIRNGQNGGLESALLEMDQANIELEVFQEMKLMGGVHTPESARYCIIASDTLIQHQGGVALLYRPLERFQVKENQVHVLNIVSCNMASRGKR